MDEKRSVQALQGLLEISKALGSEVELNALLEVIIKRATLILDADRTTVFVFDPSTQRLWSRVGEGLEAGTIELELGSGIAGDVAREKKLENIPDAHADPRFNPEFDRRNHYHTSSILCAPILNSEGALLGVIQTINKRNRVAFDSEDERVMTALASHVAVALERAHLTESFLERKRFEESLKVASDIQVGMLPRTLPDTPPNSPFEIAAMLRPARHVGGDFYDFRHPAEGKLFFCIGDVSGKGVPAALMMAVTRTLFRANSSILPTTAEIMTAVNRVLCEETNSSMFVTAFCAILDLSTGELEYSNAGHNPPVLQRKEGSAMEMKVLPGLVLGVAPAYKYLSERATLQPGDIFFLYTDGFTDQTDRAGQMFGTSGLLKALLSTGSAGPAGMIDAALDAVDRFSPGTPQFDDLTALCVRFRGVHGALHESNGRVEGRFARRIDVLEGVFDLAESFFAANGLDSAARYAIGVVIEEVFTNMVKYNPEGKGELTLRLRREEDEVTIELVDFDSPDFNPLDNPEVDVNAPIEARRPGGLGIHLLRKLMDNLQYAHDNRRSTLTFVKKLNTGLGAGAPLPG